ncbi:hypothetical protein AN958_08426 [Leucoagaricus sp. SymC.cos]|nr:hypothetical protein AN958_08426 [Leucoagaricus sp. SymC.cos]
MSMPVCWWIVALALLQCIAAQTTGIIHLFSSSRCSGSHMSCGDIPPNGCCTTGGDVFASAILVSRQEDALLGVYAQTECKGVSRQGVSLVCIQPTFAFSAARWTGSAKKSRRNDTEPSSEFDDCRRPNLITLVDDNGEEVNITIPDGENTDYERAFVQGDFVKLMKLANINRSLRFSR